MTKTILVNKDNKIKENYLKKLKLVSTKNINNKDVLIEEEALENYLLLKEFLLSKNIKIGIISAYKSLEETTNTDEHYTGLAIDIALIIDNKIITNDNSLEYDNIYQEIHKYLKDFGFILRYPKDKEQITNYTYRPYHIRYVGKFVANIIYEKKYTLEEYSTKYSGIVFINKGQDITSFDVVNDISKLFGIKRVGHTGTLDPLATGVLIIAIGQATKVVELLTATYKEYIAEVKLGIKTDTLDITGTILDTKDIPSNIDLNKTLNSFKKTYLQEVPIYSAVKVNGKKLYEYARNNEYVELPKKEVTIKEIDLLSQNDDTFTFKALVSKGCYIRSLINDIGESLNTYATMTKLTRTKQGIISLDKTNSMEDIKNENINIFGIEDVLDYPIIEVDEYLEKMIRTGRPLINKFDITEKVIFKDKNNTLLGIYYLDNDTLKVWKNFI